jgi:hypothetical protein
MRMFVPNSRLYKDAGFSNPTKTSKDKSSEETQWWQGSASPREK